MAATEVQPYITSCLWNHDRTTCQTNCTSLTQIPPSIRRLLPPSHLSNTLTIDLVVFEMIKKRNILIQKCQSPSLRPIQNLAEKLLALGLHFRATQKDLYFIKRLINPSTEAIYATEQFSQLPIQGLSQKLEEAIGNLSKEEGEVCELLTDLKELLKSLSSDDPNLLPLLMNKFSKIEKIDRSEKTGDNLWNQAVCLLEHEINTMKRLFKTAIAQFEPKNPLSTQKYRDGVLSKIVAKKCTFLSANDVLTEIEKVSRLLQAYKKILHLASSLQNKSKSPPSARFELLVPLFNKDCLEEGPYGPCFRESHEIIPLNEHQKQMRDAFYNEYHERLGLIRSLFIAAYAKKRSEEKAPINNAHLNELIESVYAFIKHITKQPREVTSFIIPLSGERFELQTHLEEVEEMGKINPDHPYAIDAMTSNLLDVKKNLNITLTKILSDGLKNLMAKTRAFKNATQEARKNQSPAYLELKEQLTQQLQQFEELNDALYTRLPMITAKIDLILKVGKRKEPRIVAPFLPHELSLPIQEETESMQKPLDEIPVTSSEAASSSEPMLPSQPIEDTPDVILSEREIEKTIRIMEQCSTEIQSLAQQYDEPMHSDFQRNVRLRELMRELHDQGWYLAKGHRGKHRCLQHDELSGRIAIPVHGSKIVPAGTAKQIRQEARTAKPKQKQAGSSKKLSKGRRR